MTSRNKFNRYLEYLVSLWSRVRFGIKDPLSGMKGYSIKSIAVNIDQPFEGLAGTWIALRSIKIGCKFKELDISVSKRHDASRFGSSWRGELKILKVLFNIEKNLVLQMKRLRGAHEK